MLNISKIKRNFHEEENRLEKAHIIKREHQSIVNWKLINQLNLSLICLEFQIIITIQLILISLVKNFI